MMDDTCIFSKARMCLVSSDRDSGQIEKCVGEDVLAGGKGLWRVQGRELQDIRPGIELVACAVCKDVL